MHTHMRAHLLLPERSRAPTYTSCARRTDNSTQGGQDTNDDDDTNDDGDDDDDEGDDDDDDDDDGAVYFINGEVHLLPPSPPHTPPGRLLER